ncbi:unnamed protein product, partial [Ectocarpus sp. 4 AP-2014]
MNLSVMLKYDVLERGQKGSMTAPTIFVSVPASGRLLRSHGSDHARRVRPFSCRFEIFTSWISLLYGTAMYLCVCEVWGTGTGGGAGRGARVGYIEERTVVERRESWRFTTKTQSITWRRKVQSSVPR